jgi:hypothetical protein
MGERYVEMSGDFDKLDPIIRDEARQELSQFLETPSAALQHAQFASPI